MFTPRNGFRAQPDMRIRPSLMQPVGCGGFGPDSLAPGPSPARLLRMENYFFLTLAAVFLSGCQTPTNQMREIGVEVTVPDPAWEVSIEEIYQADGRLNVISRLTRDEEAMAAQVISTIEDRVTVAAPDLPVDHYLLGKTWDWREEEHHFVANEEELAPLRRGKRIFPE